MKNVQNAENLWMEYSKNRTDSVKKQLIEAYVPLIKIIASKIKVNAYQGLDFNDLMSYGIVGLIDAIDKFNPTMNVKFESYATIRIRGEIIDSIRRIDWAPRYVRKNQKNISSAVSLLEDDLGRTPTEEEVCYEIGVTLEEYTKMLDEINLLQVSSIDEQFKEVNNSPKKEPSTEEVVEKEEVLTALAESIENLPERDQQIVKLYYFEELSLKEIGKLLGISDSRTSQLHIRSISRLREMLDRRNITCPL